MPNRPSAEAPRAAASPAPPRTGGAVAVAAGILASRIAGLVRERAIAHYLGISPATDAFRAALRIPNLLQNLLGEGVLSASFIPVYARLRAEGRESDAARLARTVGSLLVLVTSAAALLGIAFAEPLVALLAPGFDAATTRLTVQLVRIMFPGIAFLVLSAWCLGVLSAHRRFFLSYASPVLWNSVQIAALVVAGRSFMGDDFAVATWLAWGAAFGSAAQLLVQLPSVVRLVPNLRPELSVRDESVKKSLNTFVPVLLGRGSVQLSAYVDQIIATSLGSGMLAALSNAQTLSLLPISLFGMAISASELPALSSALGDAEARAAQLRQRLQGALRRVLFFVVPSAVAFASIGDFIVALLFQTGRFGADDTHSVWLILIGSALGLAASTQARLLASGFYALSEPNPPFRAALVRVVLTGSMGWLIAMPLRERLGFAPIWGALGLTASSGASAWLEFALLRGQLKAKLGGLETPTRLGFGALAAALVAGACARLAGSWVGRLFPAPWLCASLACAVFGGVYIAIMASARVQEAQQLVRRIRRR